MPTYDYECTHCGYTFEVFQRMNETILKKCPKCKKNLKRLIGAGSGVIFKGSGFYATDYRKKTSDTKSDTKACPKAQESCHGCPGNKTAA